MDQLPERSLSAYLVPSFLSAAEEVAEREREREREREEQSEPEAVWQEAAALIWLLCTQSSSTSCPLIAPLIVSLPSLFIPLFSLFPLIIFQLYETVTFGANVTPAARR